MSKKKTARLKVKYARLHNTFSDTLEEIIWKSASKEQDFLKNLAENSIFEVTDYRYIGRFLRLERLKGGILNAISGELIKYIPANDVEALEKKSSPPQYVPIGGMDYFVEAHIYFLIVDDHVAYLSIPTAGGCYFLEKYLTSFFRNYREIRQYEKVMLVPNIQTENGVALSSVASVGISVYKKGKHSGVSLFSYGERSIKKEDRLSLLKSIGVESEDIDRMKDHGIIKNLALKMDFERDQPRVDVDVFFRHIPEEDLVLKGPEGKEEKGLLQLSMKRQFEKNDPNYPTIKQASAEREMIETLKEWVKEGKIKIPPERFIS